MAMAKPGSPRESGGPARARRPHRRILPLHEGPMWGLATHFGIDRAPSRRLQRPRRARVAPAAGAKTPPRTCLEVKL